jgi:hypothetical protein
MNLVPRHARPLADSEIPGTYVRHSEGGVEHLDNTR